MQREVPVTRGPHVASVMWPGMGVVYVVSGRRNVSFYVWILTTECM